MPKPTKSCSGVISLKGYEFQKERYLLLSDRLFDSVKVERLVASPWHG
jgi:hypothetical protein